MPEFFIAVGVAVTGWWFFTGLVLWLVHLPQRYHGVVFRLATVVFLTGLAFLPALDTHTSVSGSVLGFTMAIVLWGWLEMGYLMDKLSGLHKVPCPVDAPLGERFRRGLGTCVYHELAVVVTAFLIAILADGGRDSVVLWAFCTLWLMRWSTKLNLILGVRNYNRDWLPARLQYVDTYIQRRAMNALFPLSFSVASLVTVWVFLAAAGARALPEQVSLTLVGTLLLLGTLEHVFLMLPLRESRLWRWAAPRDKSVA